jgi:hypothetical protein
LSAIDAYSAEVKVVEVAVIPALVANTFVPATSYNLTVYDVLFVTAPHDTSIDFETETVGAAATGVGMSRKAGIETAVNELTVVPLPNSPYVFLPQHFTVVSASTAHEW